MSAPTVQPIFARNILARTISSFYIRPQPFGIADEDQFNPRSLYQNNEQGFWYNPRDFSTMFQDAAGTTPVTAVGQSVGLMLDKRKGPVLGSELVTNGGFDSDTGWTKQAGWSISGGRAVASIGASASNLSSTGMSVSAGLWYEIIYTINSISAGGFRVSLGGYTEPVYRTAPGTYRIKVLATTTTGVAVTAQANSIGEIDNISVKELPGNHAYQTTAASRPTVEARVNHCLATEDATAWSKLNNGTGVLPVVTANAGTDPFGGTAADLVVFNKGAGTATTDYSLLIVGGTLVQGAGLSYTQGIWLKTNDGTSRTLRCTAPDGQTTTFAVTSSWQLFSYTQIAGSSSSGRISLRIMYAGDIGGANNTANILVFGAQSVDGASLGTYQRVNTATDYVDVGAPRYNAFDKTDDHLLVAAGGAGTTGFLLACGIVVPAAGTARTIFSDRGTNAGYSLGIDATNKVVFSGGTGAAFTTLTSANALTAGQKYAVIAWHDGTNLNLSINNVPETPVACGTVTAGTATFTIGKDNGAASGYWGDRIYTAVYRRNDSSSAAQRSGLYTYIVGEMGGL